MDRITDANYYPEGEFCIDCPDHGEPNGCNRDGGECDAYAVFVTAYEKLREYEDTGLLTAEIVAMREELAAMRVVVSKMENATEKQSATGNLVTANRVLSLAEVLALPEGARVWVEHRNLKYKDQDEECRVVRNCKRGDRVMGFCIVGKSGMYWQLDEHTSRWFAEDWRVWSLPVAPTEEELRGNPWVEKEKDNA